MMMRLMMIQRQSAQAHPRDELKEGFVDVQRREILVAIQSNSTWTAPCLDPFFGICVR